MTDEEATVVVRVLRGFYTADLAKLDANAMRDMLRSYSAGLRDLDFEEVQHAIEMLAKGSKWMPKVSEIRDAVVAARHGRPRAGVEAWSDVVTAIKDWGRHNVHGVVSTAPGDDFDFRDPDVQAVVVGLGWAALVDSDNRVSDRARFIEAYDDRVRAKRQDAAVAAGARTPELPGPAVPVGLLLQAMKKGGSR